MTQVDEGPDAPSDPGTLMSDQAPAAKGAPAGASAGTPDTAADAPRVGEVLAERYQLQEHINDDAFGRQVWRGVDVVLRRPVAVVLRYPGGESAVEMLDAAVAASRVVHPHLVDVYDAIDEGSRAYVVREWVDGGSLREYLTEGPLEPDRATAVASAVASAVAAVHATGMAHGNVHPGTVLIGSDGRVVLADARADEAATPDADVRAVGAVLYSALTGHWPQAEAGATSLPDAARDANGAVVPARQIRGGVPGHLSDLASDLIDPELAPPSADVLAAELARLDTEREDAFFTEGGPLDFEPRQYGSAPPREVRRSGAKRYVAGIAALAVLAVIGLLVAIKFLPGGSTNGGGSPTASATSTAGAGQANGKPVQLSIAANQVRIIDPPKGSRSELGNAGNVVDGKDDTAWKTEHYNTADFGNLKPGMGVFINLGSAKKVSSVKITFSTPGASVALTTGTINPASSSDGDQQVVDAYTTGGNVLGQKDDAGTTVVFNADGTPRQYLMVWITKLPPADDGRFQVGIDEIQVFANE